MTCRRVPLLALLPLLVAAPLMAQSLAVPADAPARVAVTMAAATPLTAATVMPSSTAAVEANVAAALRARRGEGTILMIVGGAAILTGIIVEEDIITVAGAVVGLYGLYRYLKAGN